MTKRFALIGAAGYVAPRHMKAIKDVGGELVAALDPHDSVGILDSHFPRCQFFKEPERFDHWLSMNPVDYVSITSPNYIHSAHSIMAMRNGADVICEKPLACDEKSIESLLKWEYRTGRKINCILQCRLHPEAIKAKQLYDGKTADVRVLYCTYRGDWYFNSWKNDIMKSGGLATNIGIHLFDLCMWMFGRSVAPPTATIGEKWGFGRMRLERADVSWKLSLCSELKRKFLINEYSLDLTKGFNDLHTESYRQILKGNGFGIHDAAPSVLLVDRMRNAS